jgi:hypothetical protein
MSAALQGGSNLSRGTVLGNGNHGTENDCVEDCLDDHTGPSLVS